MWFLLSKTVRTMKSGGLTANHTNLDGIETVLGGPGWGDFREGRGDEAPNVWI